MHVVEEAEGDALAVGTVLGTVDVVVPELRVGHVDVDGVFGGVFVEVRREGDLAQYEARAEGFATHEGDLVPLGAECRVDRVHEVGEVQLVLVRVAYRDVEVGVAVLVAVLECHVGEDGALFRGVVHVDALVEPGLLGAEAALRVFADVDGRIAFLFFDGNLPDFDTVDFVAVILERSGRVHLRCHPRGGGDLLFTAVGLERHLEHCAVEPRPTEVGDAVQVLARDYGEVLPEGISGNLLAFDECAEGILLRLVGRGDFFFPGFVEFLLANPEDFFECPVERYPVGARKFCPDFWDGVFAVMLCDVAYECEALRVGPEFGKQRVVREVVHVFEREQAVVQHGDAQQHVAVGVPGVEPHAGGFELRRALGEPERLQREGDEGREVARDAFVVVVGVADLQPVDIREDLATVLYAHQVAEFVRDDVGKPAVAAADLEVPVGEPQVHRVFARDGATVAVERIVEHRVYAARQVLLVAAHDGIVDCFGIRREHGCMLRIFLRVNELEMLRVGGFPLDIALVAVKTGSVCGYREECRGTT